MRQNANSLELTATDLVGFLNCRHLSYLDLAVVDGNLTEPDVWDPMLKLLWERGSAHEAEYVAHLMQAGLDVARIDAADLVTNAEAQTLAATRRGVSIIAELVPIHSANWATDMIGFDRAIWSVAKKCLKL